MYHLNISRDVNVIRIQNFLKMYWHIYVWKKLTLLTPHHILRYFSLCVISAKFESKDIINQSENNSLPFTNWPDRFRRPQYEHRLLLFQMITLEYNRRIAQVALVHSIIRGDVSSQFTLDRMIVGRPHYQARVIDFLSLPNRKYD